MPAGRFNRVLFPEPLRPTTARNCPARTSSVSVSTARTRSTPTTYSLTTSTRRTAGPGARPGECSGAESGRTACAMLQDTQLAQARKDARHRPLPEPLRPDPEVRDHRRMQPAVLLLDGFVASSRERVKADHRMRGIDDPVLRHARRAVVLELLAPVPLH